MSSHARASGGSDKHHNNGADDVERHRQRNRQADRQHREQQQQHDDEGDHKTRHRDGDDRQKQQHTSEREQRMARLREELKQEDETLAQLDQQQAEKGKANAAERNKRLPQEAIIEVRPEELEGLDEDEQMQKLLGFGGFGSTKGKAVEDNQSTAARGGAAKNKARKYRQYMNRKSGFNRPLEKMN